jgi:outer membrane protein assembly factor BamE (lipoprotein component of BamABCDE complex)
MTATWKWILVAIAAALALAACVPVPLVPRELQGSRQDIGEHRPDFIVEGVTTREDILVRLGEPDRRGYADRWFAYRSRRSEGGVLLVVPYGAGFAAGAESVRYRRLVVSFDSRGLVESVGYTDRICPSYMLGDERYDSGTCFDVATGDIRVDGLNPEQVVLNLEPDERVRERFVGAAFRSDGQWVSGMVIVTSRALLFVCWPDPCPGQLLPPRLTASQIVQVGPGRADALQGEPTAELTLIDGSREVFGFRGMPDGVPQAAGAFDRARTERFIESVRLLLAPPR